MGRQEWNFTARLEPAQSRTYQRHLFEVPAGGRELEIRFEYQPTRVDRFENLLCLSLFDSGGFRGAGHRGGPLQEVRLAAESATPGYLAGAIDPGIWELEVDVHQVLGSHCDYWIQVAVEGEPEGEEEKTRARSGSALPESPEQMTAPAESGVWLAGDLHAHTNHSDGLWSAEELLGRAAELGFDFAAITDHNTVSPHWKPLPASPTLLLAGMELTTYRGHAVVLGSRNWIDWRVSEERSMARIFAEVGRQGHTFIIAHPRRIGNPLCTGCRWQYSEMAPGPAGLVEIWNGGREEVEANRELWFSWLNQGHRLYATAGSDAHAAPHFHRGMPHNRVFSRSRTSSAILEAIRSGTHYLTRGPELVLERLLPASGDRQGNGDLEVLLSLRWEEAPPGATVAFIENGRTVVRLPANESGNTVIPVPADNAWRLVEMRDSGGEMLAITNPVFASRRGEKT